MRVSLRHGEGDPGISFEILILTEVPQTNTQIKYKSPTYQQH